MCNAKENKEVKVSVIVPVYNATETLLRCAANLINQTLDEIEIIFVDDCSNDGSYELLLQLESMYSYKVKVIKCEKNSGPGGARNRGLDIAEGKYIGFVDADDYVDVLMYEKLYKKAEEAEYDIVDCLFVDEEVKSIIQSIPNELTGELDYEKKRKLIAGEGYIWNKLWRKKMLDEHELRFREKAIMEDTDFVILAYALAERIAVVQEALYQHTFNSASVTKVSNEERWAKQSCAVMQAVYDKMVKLSDYNELKTAVEAMLISLYFNAVFRFINSDNLAFDEKVKYLKEIAVLKQRLVTGGYDNEYIIGGLNEDCVNMMRLNDKAPEELVKIFCG